MKRTCDKKEGLIALVHQLVAHVPVIDEILDQFGRFSEQINSSLDDHSMTLKQKQGIMMRI